MSTSTIVKELLEGHAEQLNPEELASPSTIFESSLPTTDLPTTLSDLHQTFSRTYDLSVTMAGQLSIPVGGGISGGFDRHVVVLERKALKAIEQNSIRFQYGYVIRLAITVSKIKADMKLTLPFLAASAEVGHVEGKWILQVVGLSGSEIDSAMLPPQQLSVETFVLARQSLEKMIKAVHNPTTTFTPVLLTVIRLPELIQQQYKITIGKAYAIGRIERGASINEAFQDLDSADNAMRDTIRDTYNEFAGISTNLDEEPSPEVRQNARNILGGVSVRPV